MSTTGYMTPDERPNRPSRQSSGGDSDEISNERSGEQSYESSDVDQTDTSSSVEIITDNIRNTTLNGTATGRPKLRPKSLNARARSSDYRHHMSFLSGSTPGQNIQNTQHEEIRTTPLFSGGVLSTYGPVLPQYGLLAQRLDVQQSIEDSHLNLIQLQDPIPGIASSGDDPRLFLNTNTPWSTFICGSQGSGKSHTLSVMLENALLPSSLGKLPNPLAGIVFHYDRFTSYASNQICESAYLCSSNIPVKVLVSPTNYWRMKSAYENLSGLPANARKPEVIPLRFKEKQLDASRMMSLMSVSDKDGPMPLYIETILRILRQMAIEGKGAPGIRYEAFKQRLGMEGFTFAQNGPLKLRLDLLDSFMDLPSHSPSLVPSEKPQFPDTKNGRKAERVWDATWAENMRRKIEEEARIWNFEPGSLTIVDLSCPFVDDSAACALFTICLELFLENRGAVGRVIALDEAHKFMTGTASADNFTENLLQVIRQQRHLATRVIIATQEPTISPKLLDLSTMTIVHRFTSPDWLGALTKHLAGVSSVDGEAKRDIREIFKTIVNLEAGQALFFSPSAILDIVHGDEEDSTIPYTTKLGMGYVKMRVRKRLTADGGRSIMAV